MANKTFHQANSAGIAMIVCSCNVLSDHEVRAAAMASSSRTAGQVYGCLGCSVQCGRCARTIRKIIEDAVGKDALACPLGCGCALHATGQEAMLTATVATGV